jgi:uncharacterized membrane protein
MNGRLFWLTAALLVGIAAHIAYILFVPRTQMDAKMSDFTALAGTNKLVVVEPDVLATVLPGADPGLAHAVCVFDLASGPVLIKAAVPAGYWLISFYAPNGDSFYSLNDRQADVRTLNLLLTPKSSDPGIDRLSNPQVGEGSEIAVKSPSARGLVLLRARIEAAALRTRVMGDLATSFCGRAN